MNTELNNITILISGLIIVSIAALFMKNEYIATTVIGGLIGYLSKDVNINLEEGKKEENKTSTNITFTPNTSNLGYQNNTETTEDDDSA